MAVIKLTKNISYKESNIKKNEDINIDATIDLNYNKVEYHESTLIISFGKLNGFI